MIVSSASASHSGLVRANNEDALIARLPPESPSSTGSTAESKGALFAVADGVGGANAGEIASQAAVAVLAEEYYSPRAPHQIEAALRQAMTAANLRVYNLAHGRDPDLHGMQTTLTALVLAGNQAYIGHIGDCRVYVWRGGGSLSSPTIIPKRPSCSACA